MFGPVFGPPVAVGDAARVLRSGSAGKAAFASSAVCRVLLLLFECVLEDDLGSEALKLLDALFEGAGGEKWDHVVLLARRRGAFTRRGPVLLLSIVGLTGEPTVGSAVILPTVPVGSAVSLPLSSSRGVSAS